MKAHCLLLKLLMFAAAANIYAQVPSKNYAVSVHHPTTLFQHLKKDGGTLLAKTGPSYKTEAVVSLMDSIYSWKWDSATQAWKVDSRTTYTYDGNHNRTSMLGSTWNGTAWVNDDKTTYTFDANNNEVGSLSQTWNGTAWDNANQITSVFDANNNSLSNVFQNWNGTTWVNSGRFTYTYDANNNQTSSTSQNWNGTTWVNEYKYANTYNAGNYLTSATLSDWDGSAWVNWELYMYTYDVNNNHTVTVHQTWNGSAWVNDYRETFTYDVNNNLTVYLNENWNGTAWENFGKSTFVNVNNNRQRETFQLWSGTAWDNTFIWSYTHDANHNETSWTTYNWEGGAYQPSDSFYYYYTIISGINDLPVQERSIIVYPNPAGNELTIHTLSANSNASAVVSVLNSSGEMVLEEKQNGTGDITIHINSLAPGIYFLQMKSEKGRVTKRFIKE